MYANTFMPNLNDIDQALEFARCAQVNFEHLVQQIPALKTYPLTVLVRSQIDSTIKELEKPNE